MQSGGCAAVSYSQPEEGERRKELTVVFRGHKDRKPTQLVVRKATEELIAISVSLAKVTVAARMD